ncbi:MAG: outer membrane beta-barrel protein [Bacteroidetes bacterium]|nr:outer membrane beta-barrel protein [Bacteroidota bacterium]
MKKSYLVILIITFCSLSHGQSIRGWGGKVGVNILKEDWNHSFEYYYIGIAKPFPGINAVIFIECQYNPTFLFVVEAAYTKSRINLESNSTIAHPDCSCIFGDWVSKKSSLDISILGKIKSEQNIFSPYLLIGPSISFTLENTTTGYYSLPFNDNRNIYDEISRLRIGIKVGAGTEVEFQTLNLLFEIIFQKEINNLYETDELKISSSSWNFRFGFLL